jgi:hypothetical protein
MTSYFDHFIKGIFDIIPELETVGTYNHGTFHRAIICQAGSVYYLCIPAGKLLIAIGQMLAHIIIYCIFMILNYRVDLCAPRYNYLELPFSNT